MQEVYVAKSEEDKKMQRALLQYFNPKNHHLVEKALKKAKRFDLIGYDSKCLIAPLHNRSVNNTRFLNQSSKYQKGKRKKR